MPWRAELDPKRTLVEVTYTGRPTVAQENGIIGLFRLDPDGGGASKVQVKLGRVSANTVEIVQGLVPGDRVILSDVSVPDNTERIRIR